MHSASDTHTNPIKQVQAVRRSGARNALTLMVGTLASRLSGFVRQVILVAQFPPAVTDAFFIAYRVPNFFRELLAEGALTNSFIPVYKSLSPAEARRLSGAMLNILIGVNALLIALCVLLAPQIVGVLLRDGSNVDVDLAVRLTRIVFPFLMAISLSTLAQGILNAEERFFATAWAPAALNVVATALMLLLPGRETVLAVAFVVGGVAQLVVQLPSLARFGLLPSFGRLWHTSLPTVLLLMVPFTLTTGARQVLNLMASRSLSILPEGNVTAFENANFVFTLALSLFSVSPALAFYSRLSSDAVQAPDEFPKTLRSGVQLIGFLTVPAGLLTFILAAPATLTLFAWRSSVDRDMLTFSIRALAPLGLAVFPWGVNNLLIRPYYVRKRIRLPIALSVVFISLNALLYAILAPRYGIEGMSWGTVVVGWAQFVVMLYYLRKDEGLEVVSFLRHAARVWVAAGFAAGAMVWLLAWLPTPAGWLGSAVQVTVGGVGTVALYALLSMLLGLPELEQLSRRLRRGR